MRKYGLASANFRSSRLVVRVRKGDSNTLNSTRGSLLVDLSLKSVTHLFIRFRHMRGCRDATTSTNVARDRLNPDKRGRGRRFSSRCCGGFVRRRRDFGSVGTKSSSSGEIPMMMMSNKTSTRESVDVNDDALLRPPAKNNNNEAFQQLAISSSLPKRTTNDENDVFDATAIVFSVVGFNLCFLLGLAVWVKGLKTRYENAIWKIKRLGSEKRDLAVAHNMEKADLADPMRAGSTSGGEYGSGYGRRGGAAAAVSTSASGGADDVMIQGLKAERDALKQALKTTQTQMQQYVRENAALENRLETALLEVEKLTPS